MCNFRMWYKSEDDVYVLQCVQCNTYQVRMRNSAFMFDTFTYTLFCEVVADLYSKSADNKPGESIKVPTFNQGVELAMERPALRELFYLLDGADTEMKAAQMTSLFYY